MALSIYQLKPAFQSLLRPLVQRLFASGVTANTVTVLACLISVGLGGVLWWAPSPAWFAALPIWMFVRMAFNAVDGMLAREFGQRSTLGAYLNELTDVLSDAALYAPFARVAPFDAHWVACVVLLAALSEMAGALGPTVGASRRYDGPMGKSDRAFVFGALGLLVSVWGRESALPAPLAWVLPLVAGLTACCIYNRVQAGRREADERRTTNQL